jgi:hypothetical protein
MGGRAEADSRKSNQLYSLDIQTKNPGGKFQPGFSWI